jgi:hypothetical protein
MLECCDKVLGGGLILKIRSFPVKVIILSRDNLSNRVISARPSADMPLPLICKKFMFVFPTRASASRRIPESPSLHRAIINVFMVRLDKRPGCKARTPSTPTSLHEQLSLCNCFIVSSKPERQARPPGCSSKKSAVPRWFCLFERR